jgi:hypothetical protein
MSDANSRQVGGDHYKNGKCEHWDFVELNGLRYLEGCATKYATRNRKKHDDPRMDLQKAGHYTEKLIDLHQKGFILPRSAPVRVSVTEFADANDLTPDERTFVHLLTYWMTVDELRNAQEILQGMIAKFCPGPGKCEDPGCPNSYVDHHPV